MGFADLEMLGVLCLNKSECSDSGVTCLECVSFADYCSLAWGVFCG